MPVSGVEFIQAVVTDPKVQQAAASDWVTWQNQVSPITVLTTIGLLVSLGMWIFRVGGRNNEIASAQKGLDDLKKKVDGLAETRATERDRDRMEREAFQVAMNAGVAATEGRMAEFKEHAAKTFATKIEVAALEERTNRGMDRIVDRLDQISTRLESIGDHILKALTEAASSRRGP
jgi:methyl-accepting chemotaxis protein